MKKLTIAEEWLDIARVPQIELIKNLEVSERKKSEFK